MPSKFTLVCHGGRPLFHPKCATRRRLANVKAPFAAALLLLLASDPIGLSAQDASPFPIANPAVSGSLYEPVHDSVILRSLDLLFKGEYAAADSALARLPESPARAYFRGLVGINRFEDLGDTTALFAAARLWNALDRAYDSAGSSSARDPNYPLYRGLTELQLSYVAEKTGARLRAVRLGRKAVKLLAPLSDRAEAAAALALYDYYKAALLTGMAWLP
ncbi:MAG: hypothetical protein ABI036_07725, partial [Fibrobacteria bacterium]